jgi:YD repeat-containing protein
VRTLVLTITLVVTITVSAAEWPKPLTWRPGAVPGSVVGMDAAGRVVQITLADGRTIHQDYLPNGKQNRQSTSTGRPVQIEYAARNRIKSVTDDGVTRWQIYDEGDDLLGIVQARSYSDVNRLLKLFGLKADDMDQTRPVFVHGSDGRLSSAANALARTRFEYNGAGSVRQWLETPHWNVWIDRNQSERGIALMDSAGGSYSYIFEATTTRLLDAAGNVLATWTYDSQHRVQRVDIIGTIVIEYVYGAAFDWREKIIRQPNGPIIKRFSRHDYDDPADASSLRAELRAATGERLAEIDGNSVVYTAGVLAPYLHLTSEGKVIDRVFTAGSSVPYCNDEIRIQADGTIRIFPALPHAEFTVAARSVMPFEVRISSTAYGSSQALKPARSSNGKGTSALSRRLVPVPKLAAQFTSCEWIPGGTTSIDGMTIPGRWDCQYGWVYFPDPVLPPPVDGGGPGTPDAGGMPLTPTEIQLLNQAKSVANNRLSTVANCEKMFDDLGANGANVISATTYRDGAGSAKCSSRPGAAAVTDVGSYTVFLCGLSFTNLSSNGAATIVIHEALHSAGMSENPPDPGAKTSAEISTMVQANCSLSW